MRTPVPSTITAEPLEVAVSDVRVVVVDGRRERREIMSYLLGHCGPDVSVVGYGADPTSAVEAVGRSAANAALVEIQLPVSVGLDTISSLRQSFPGLRIVVCSFCHGSTTREAALARGADAYLAKPVTPRDLRPLLRPPRLDDHQECGS